MKKLQVLIVAVLLSIPMVFATETTTANSFVQIVPKTKHYSKKSYRKGRWVTVTSYRHGRKITKKVWVKGKHIGSKVGHKTKTIVMGEKHTTP